MNISRNRIDVISWRAVVAESWRACADVCRYLNLAWAVFMFVGGSLVCNIIVVVILVSTYFVWVAHRESGQTRLVAHLILKEHCEVMDLHACTCGWSRL